MLSLHSKLCLKTSLSTVKQAVIDYFEDTYIGRLRPGGRDIMQYLSPQYQHVKNTSHVSALCQPKRFFLKTTNLPEVILVTVALSVSYALEKP